MSALDSIYVYIGLELGVCERLVALAQEAVEAEVAITDDVVVDGVTLTVHPKRKLVAPPPPPPQPTIIPQNDKALNEVQLATLSMALQTGASLHGGTQEAAQADVSTDVLQMLLMRLACSSTDLPSDWAKERTTGFRKVASLLAWWCFSLLLTLHLLCPGD